MIRMDLPHLNWTLNAGVPEELIEVFAYAKWEDRCRQAGHEVHGHHEEDWLEIDRALPYLRALLDTFAAQRLLYASGWPHSNLSATYDEVYDINLALLESVGSEAQQAIMGGTAAALYRL